MVKAKRKYHIFLPILSFFPSPMAMILQPWRILSFLTVFFIWGFPLCLSQSNSPQNIETFYPFQPPLSSSPPPAPPFLMPPHGKSTSKRTIAIAVGSTAAGTLVISLLLFFFAQKVTDKRRERKQAGNLGPNSHGGQPVVSQNEFSRVDGNLKGFIVDENGLDVIYWRKLERRKSKQSLNKEPFENVKFHGEEGRKSSDEPIQEIPLLRGKSSTSHIQSPPQFPGSPAVGNLGPSSSDSIQSSMPPPSLSPPPTPPPQLPPSQPFLAIPKNNPAPSPPPPPPTANKSPIPPPPPPVPANKGATPPPAPPPKPGSSNLSLKPPPVPKGTPGGGKQAGKPSSGDGQVVMKPLHWDKVNTNNTEHSMVWDKIDGGSFRFDGDLMEALFGSVASNRKSPQRNSNSNAGGSGSSPPRKSFILDPKKSQNIAIVIKSMTISRKEIVDALMDGHGLDIDNLEKLARIAPTQEEQSQILDYNGDPLKLADAEFFLYYLLKSVPSAFSRLDAMLFKSNYDLETVHLKECLQTLESGCKELKTRGLFMKLLEAILKAGNRMNAGTARGNAQAFNLTALRKLSDVKSTDGKTTLLHFVVEEVVRSEGKKCVLNRNKSLSRIGCSSSNNNSNPVSKDERVNEYMMLGLPVIGGLSAEFSNVKKAAGIDYDTFASTCAALMTRASESRKLLAWCANDGGGFAREMRGFLEAAEDELKGVREEQTRVLELVKTTTEYYHAGTSKDREAHPLQLFVIIKDFLDLVDQVCVGISRDLQRRKTTAKVNIGSPQLRTHVKFPNLPDHFMSDKSKGTSSDESDDDL